MRENTYESSLEDLLLKVIEIMKYVTLASGLNHVSG
jgi:hypothetical protein